MKIILLIIFISFTFSLYSIEVGGHLTEDTTWSPVNNPYLVTENIHIESGVTLTILPGTEIKLSGATLTSWSEYSQNFWLYGGDSIAKMFWVDGRIVAEGTEQDSIIFTRMQNDPDYCWGCIYSPEQADMSIFKYCKFEHSAGMGIYVGRVAWNTLSCYNGMVVVQNCDLLNYRGGLSVGYTTKYTEILYNKFSYNANLNSFILSSHITDLSVSTNEEGYKPALIAGNHFPNRGHISLSSINFVNNINSISDIHTGSIKGSYFYDNTIANNQGWGGIQGGNVGDSIYIKNNQFIGGGKGIYLDDAYVEITDNYFEESALDGPSSPYYSSGKVENNIINGTNSGIRGRFEIVRNNIIMNCGVGKSVIGSSDIFQNNIFYGCEHLCSGISDNSIHENNIYLANDEIFQHTNSVHGNPIFRNCILDFELPEGCIDGGGNIWVDSLQVQELFEDIQNGDFHIIEGSLAIDAGFNTLNYHLFDLDYNQRVWDGNGNGQARIDIGPYEYGAPTLSSIEGFIYNPINGEPVDYVLIKINNQPGEFTFSSGSGDFQYKLPAGVYDIYAERVFYEDVIEYEIEVFDGQITHIQIPMQGTVDVEEHTIIPLANNFNLSNYPNPFNPTTEIRFQISDFSEIGSAEISIYNLKGQKVRTLHPFPNRGLGTRSVIWNGTDENNKPVSSGVYLYQINIDNKPVANNKMLLLK